MASIKLKRSVWAVVSAPGNPQEQAFADGYKSVGRATTRKSTYAKQNPDWYEAGRKAATNERSA